MGVVELAKMIIDKLIGFFLDYFQISVNLNHSTEIDYEEKISMISFS